MPESPPPRPHAPLHERDPEAYRAQLAEANRVLPRKLVSADVLFRDHAGRVLLVEPTYKPGWDLPGGMANGNEAPHRTAQREVREELGLDLPVGRLLVVDWVPPQESWDDLLAFLYDGGTLTDAQAADIRLTDGELHAVAFHTPGDAQHLLPDGMKRLLTAALDAQRRGRTSYLDDGNPWHD